MTNILYYTDKLLARKNKAFEIGVYHQSDGYFLAWLELGLTLLADRTLFAFEVGLLKMFNIQITWSRRSDHAGFQFSLVFWKWMVDYSYYDTRHWNYEENRFMTNDEVFAYAQSGKDL